MSQENSIKNEFLAKLVDEKVKELLEHVDSCRIFVSFHEDKPSNNTITIDQGGGNFCAQKGQILEWVEIMKQYERNYAIRKDEASNP